MSDIKRRRFILGLKRVIFFIVILYVGLLFLNQNKLKRDLEVKRNTYKNEIAKLEEDIEDLEEEVQNSSSLKFVEKIAREELGMVKPREIIVIDKNREKSKSKNTYIRD